MEKQEASKLKKRLSAVEKELAELQKAVHVATGRGIVVESVMAEHSKELVELEDRRLGSILLYTELLKRLYPGEGLGKVVREFFKEFFSPEELARIDATLLERKNDAMVRISPYLQGFFDKLKEEDKSKDKGGKK